MEEEPISDKNFEIPENENQIHKEEKPIVPVAGKSVSLMEKEHPTLAKLYRELNDIINDSLVLRNRGRDIQKLYDVKITMKRKEIRDYEKENNIVRSDHIRWGR